MPHKNREERKEYFRLWRIKNPDKVAQHRAAYTPREDRHLIRRYGITRTEKNARLGVQGGKCANPRCRTTKHGGKNWHTDHNHTTGKLRGELCARCNVALGYIETQPGRLLGLLDYLEQYRERDNG